MKKPKSQIGVGCLEVSSLQKKYVNQALDNNRLSYGPFHRKFEEEFAKAHHRKYAIFCNSGTSALQIALHALKETYGWKDGSEVLVPAVTFIATSNTVLQNNLKPVFVDVHPQYYNIDPEKIEEKITKKTVAIMPVHLFGQPCQMDKILSLKKKYSLKMVEDSCDTMFVKYGSKTMGSWGEISCFSTYVAHLIVSGVGGFAATDSEKLAIALRSLINHGRDGIYLSIDSDKTKDKRKLFKVVQNRFKFTHLGYSYRATEMEAAIGLGQLEQKDEILKVRQKNAAYLTAGLSDLEQKGYLQLPKVAPGAEHAFMMYPIVIKNPKIKKSDLVFFLEQNLIETRDMMPLLNQPIYRQLFGNIEKRYPVAKWLNQNGFYIGCHQCLRKNELDYIIEKLHHYFR